ncbi:MAG TPA: tetratricopeptide repeat protein [Nitrospira sp.]|nr:tetratricopeptide repeat protein [Nitrospira sp.]
MKREGHVDDLNVTGGADESAGEEWIARLTRLQESLALCPTDVLARCELAALLEKLEQHEEALFNWRAVLACDPNHLKAREGLARCRRRAGRPLQSNLRGE